MIATAVVGLDRYRYKSGDNMSFSKKTFALRKLIREHLHALFEGGHGGVISYGIDTRRLFETLVEYSEARKKSPPTPELINDFLNTVNRASRPSRSLSAYSIVDSDRTGPVYKAIEILERALDPRIVAEFGKPNLKLIETQIMKVLGAEFKVKDNPSSGFDMFFGAGLDWRGVEEELQNAPRRRATV